MRDLAEIALEAAQGAGASYADVRVGRYRSESLSAREERLQGIQRAESFGFGVRCLVEGAWGFAVSRLVEREELVLVAQAAAAMARANRTIVARPVSLVPEPPHADAWQTAMTRDPLKVPIETKAGLLLAVNEAALAIRGASRVTSFLRSVQEETYFASSEGSRIDQQITRLWPGFTIAARDAVTGDYATRSGDLPPFQGGYEQVEEADLPAIAARAAEEAVVLLRARPVEPGLIDLVIEPTNLWLVIHETIGRPTELDRALGDEAAEVGGSLAAPDRVGSLRYGSDLVNVTADRTMPGGLATVAYDDEGVKARAWPIIRGGILVGHSTTREHAARIGGSASTGCSRADSWWSFPLLRMPNISLEPSAEPVGVEDLIAGVENGLHIVGVGSWSTDPQRANFQFGAGFARRISGGKIGPAVRDVAYRSGSLEFWNSCDGIGGEATWGIGGTFLDAKGEPVQTSAVTHGAPAARFRRVEVLSAGSRGRL